MLYLILIVNVLTLAAVVYFGRRLAPGSPHPDAIARSSPPQQRSTLVPWPAGWRSYRSSHQRNFG